MNQINKSLKYVDIALLVTTDDRDLGNLSKIKSGQML